jgi:AcrR family transcriptional regulator
VTTRPAPYPDRVNDAQKPKDPAGDAAARGTRRRERTRARVLDAAEQLLSRHAPEEIRIEDVAALAGISPASVYVHFGTKDGLMAAVTERVLTVATETLRSAYAAPTTPLERFAGVGSAYLKLLLEHPTVVKYLMVTGERGPRSAVEDQVVERFSELRGEFEQSIRDAVDSGAIRKVDPELLSYFLFGSWNGVAALALRRDALAVEPERVELAVIEAGLVLLEGLIQAPPPA